ncbi:dioxygenase [Paraburkholderia pallida]|uniref:Catechol 1,2-dioxygenase n=1 Tax=Paraburkholderia pallida TaxID=2547399 RepID=A0A4P7D036_9BURK|nr:dioxygenase [Paraburkholderia pallida]QBR01976.1 catechol 1,2-dioxygenase [Paraburkholderia pallida]
MTESLRPDSVIDDAATVTGIVKAAMAGTQNPRLKEIVDALVEHGHAFLKHVRLTDAEFEQGLAFVRAVGQACNDRHNEVVLLADVLGFSTLVALMNNADASTRTPGALLGPFYRGGSPEYENGESIACEDSPGAPLFVHARVLDTSGRPVADATVDVWQASPVGLYENQDESQPEHNLRGRFRTGADGALSFRSVRPAGYPVPTDGPVGALLAAQQRHPYRPAHLHFAIFAEGHATLVSQVFADDSEHLDTDVVFGVNRRLIGQFEQHAAGTGPHEDQRDAYYTLDFDFILAEGTPTYPTPPIQ